MQGGAASICGEAGCHFGVLAERWGFKTFIASDVNEIFSLALACKSLLLHVTWARETASSACFWIPLDTLWAFFFFFQQTLLLLRRDPEGVRQRIVGVCSSGSRPRPPLARSYAPRRACQSCSVALVPGLQTCISLVCVLSHIWPTSTTVSRTRFPASFWQIANCGG